ncbi:MAG: 4Fe-4S binding protein, partial [Paramuribaculum sp.]|nr:4Fe-4S binding protein [Paramuribaculum sp.]
MWFDRIQLGGAIAAMSLTVFAVWILLTLVFGRIYCSTVCPAGTLMDVSARMARRGSPGREYCYRRPQPETGYIA